MQHHQQNYGAYGRHDKAAEQPAPGRHAERTKQRAANQRANNPGQKISENAVPAALYELSRQPSSSKPNQDKPQEIHRFTPFLGETSILLGEFNGINVGKSRQRYNRPKGSKIVYWQD